jgi:uncharacterized protein YegL
MNSLPVKILTAVLTFALGVGIATLWLSTWGASRGYFYYLPAQKHLEMVFVIDTTGSMNGLLDAAKQRILRIVNGVMREQHVTVRVGLVAYRDHGDQYVTQVLPLTDDLDKVYTTLMDYEAAGGGDGPEDVRRALDDAVYNSGWSETAPDLTQVIFLVGDAPPHDDYVDSPDTLVSATRAFQYGILVNTIQCGFSGETERAWRMIADSGHGKYFAIAADGGIQAITSPYDEQLAALARKLGTTVTPYVAPYDQRVEIERRLANRRDLRHQILLLSQQRDEFLKAELNKRGDDGFDAVVTNALREQMALKHYE